jgi:hypothetical protein
VKTHRNDYCPSTIKGTNISPPPAIPTGAPNWIPVTFVWAIWLLGVSAAFGFILMFGSNIPYWDDWSMVPVLTGEQPVTLSWLWSQHNEHRIPLPRLILLGLYQLTGWDFRSGMVVNVLLLGLLAFGMIRTAKSLRGRADYADAFLPIVLLHLGNWENLLWSWQVVQIFPTVIAGALLLLIVWQGQRLNFQAVGLAGIFLVVLALCGANGLALVPVLGLWLGYMGIRYLRSPISSDKRAGFLMLVSGLVAVTLVLLYFLGYEQPVYHSSADNPGTVLITTLQFLTNGFGPVADRFWPLSGLGELALLLTTLTILVVVVWRNPSERPRALGLLAFLAGMFCLALGIGWGRPDNGLTPRYVTLAAPTLCCIYFTWLLYLPRPFRTPFVLSLCILAALLLPVNTKMGLTYAKNRRAKMANFERDLKNKVPIYLLIKRHSQFLMLSQQELLTHYFRNLHQQGFGPFQSLQDDPPFDVIELELIPTTFNEVEFHDGIVKGTGEDSYIVYTLAKPQFVYRLQLDYNHFNQEGTRPRFRMFWKRADQIDFPPDQRFSSLYLETGNDKNMIITIGDTIDLIRIYPDDKRFVFHLQELKLQVPVLGN